MNEGDILKPIEKTIAQDNINRYAEVSGDFNPIHIDEEFGKQSQFGKNIAHGMMVAATISEIMLINFGELWQSSGKMKLRFKSPVYPNDTIRASGFIKKITKSEKTNDIHCVIDISSNENVVISCDAFVSTPINQETI
ncbi:MAG: MaoC family dehydratase [Dehalococcoidia bacterium]|jgi:3-hydroxybutyryl-CoA dehydratase